MEYMVDKLCGLCYERAWYTKYGGCYAIKFFYTHMSLQWVFEHLYLFVKAQLFVIMDLSGDVCFIKKTLKQKLLIFIIYNTYLLLFL